MANKILDDIKKMLGPDQNDTSFDLDILISINSALSSLNLLGVGPKTGIRIDEETTWDILIPANATLLENVKVFIYLKVRLVFDPPQNSFLVTSMEKQIDRYGWEISILVEEVTQ